MSRPASRWTRLRNRIARRPRTPRWLRALALGATLIAVGLVFDAESLYVPGALLVVLVAATMALVRGAARGATVARETGPGIAVERQPLTIRLHASWSRRPGVRAHLTEPAADRTVAITDSPAAIEQRVRFARRGEITLEPATLVISDVLGLDRRVITGSASDRVLVLPQLYPVRIIPTGAGSAGRVDRAPHAGDAQVEIDGLRDYRPGAPASRIFWPALARGAGLVERRMRDESGTGPVVVLDAATPASADALDAAVRAAASLCHEIAHKRGGCGLLLPGERRMSAVNAGPSWRAAHARLARVQPGRAVQLARVRRASPLLLVCARPITRVPAALRDAAGPVIIVVPGELAGRRPALAVAGCHGYLAVGPTAGRVAA